MAALLAGADVTGVDAGVDAAAGLAGAVVVVAGAMPALVPVDAFVPVSPFFDTPERICRIGDVVP